MKTNSKKLMSNIIPYCSENFITIPLFEEGDYRWSLNLWYIFRFEDLIETGYESIDNIIEEVVHTVQEKYRDFEVYFEINDNFANENIFIEFNIMQVCNDILDKSFEYNYDCNDYMEVGSMVLEEIEKIRFPNKQA